jgi:hypothetical protein
LRSHSLPHWHHVMYLALKSHSPFVCTLSRKEVPSPLLTPSLSISWSKEVHEIERVGSGYIHLFSTSRYLPQNKFFLPFTFYLNTTNSFLQLWKHLISDPSTSTWQEDLYHLPNLLLSSRKLRRKLISPSTSNPFPFPDPSNSTPRSEREP